MMAETEERLVILDTDPGVDDAMAMLYLAASSNIRLHSITTVFGNAAVSQTTRNARYILQRFKIDIPVWYGADGPLTGERHIPELKVHGEDGLGNTGIANEAPDLLDDKPAWKHICDTVMANEGRVTILAIAPLTNLALALRHQPEIAQFVDQVVVMGGAFGTRGRTGNIRPYAEANFFYDAEAASEVLSADWPITIVGLDVTEDCIMSRALVQELSATGGDAGAFIRQISHGYEAIYREYDGIDGFCIHDVAAAVYVVAPHLFTRVPAEFSIGLSARTWGSSSASINAEDCKSEKKGLCVQVDAEELVTHFTETILSSRLAGKGRSE
jgi:purine nucleosidase